MALAGPARRHISQISSNSRVGPTDPPTIRGIMIRQSVRLPQRNGRKKRAGRLRNGGNVSSSCMFGKNGPRKCKRSQEDPRLFVHITAGACKAH